MEPPRTDMFDIKAPRYQKSHNDTGQRGKPSRRHAMGVQSKPQAPRHTDKLPSLSFTGTNEQCPVRHGVDSIDSVQRLLESGEDINQQLDYGSYLATAAAARSEATLEIVKLLLASGANVNQHLTSGHYGSALAAASAWGHVKVAKLLLNSGADPNQELSHGSYGSALAAASVWDHVEVAKLLLNSGADPNQELSHGSYGSALAAASAWDHVEVAKLLLNSGADPNQELSHGSYGSALAAASAWGHVEVAKLLLNAGADPNQELSHGSYESALAAASAWGHVEVAKLLLNAGADFNQELSHGSYGNALAAAINRGDANTIATLLDAGAHVSHLSAHYLDNIANGQSDPRFLKYTKSDLGKKSYQKPRVVTFDWELPSVMADSGVTEELLFSMSTLTIKTDTVELTSCREALQRMNGTGGPSLLNGIFRALKSVPQVYVDGSMAIHAVRDMVTVIVTECADSIVDMMQWICLTFRKPSMDSVCFSRSTCKSDRFQLQNLQPLPYPVVNGGCWAKLFRSAVVVLDPSLGEPQSSRGLELSFSSMLQLAAVEYPVKVKSGIILLGYSTALIPVKATDDGKILWHLEVASSNSQLKISDLSATCQPWLQTINLDDLSSKTAILGWCSEATVLLGTDHLEPKKIWSAARSQPFTWNWKNANLQLLAQSAAPIQFGGQLGMTFERTPNTLRFTPANNYIKCLQNSKIEQIILYDVRARRAWLVPLLSVLHHMLLVYAESVDGGLGANLGLMAHPESDGASASFETLIEKGEVVLQSSEEYKLTVRELVMKLSINLSQVLPIPAKRSKLYGYEFMDIVNSCTRTELKKISAERNSLAWAPLTGEVSCLFCSGVGDAIIGKRAASQLSPCNRLPEGSDMMAASMHSIEHLSKRHGFSNEAEARVLTNDHCLRVAGYPFESCEHGRSGPCCWNRPRFLQKIQDRQSSYEQVDNPSVVHANGALVFGRGKTPETFSNRRKLGWLVEVQLQGRDMP